MDSWIGQLADVGMRDGLGGDDIFWWAAGALTVITLVAALIKPVRAIRHFFHRISVFLGDWFGEPADPERGSEPIPGVMARLRRVEDDVAAQPTLREMVAKLAHEVADLDRAQPPVPGVMARLKRVEDDVATQPTLRDMVTKLAHEVADLARQVAGINARIDALHKQSATRETQTQIAEKLDDVLDNRDND